MGKMDKNGGSQPGFKQTRVPFLGGRQLVVVVAASASQVLGMFSANRTERRRCIDAVPPGEVFQRGRLRGGVALG